jgi:hypothetical protein
LKATNTNLALWMSAGSAIGTLVFVLTGNAVWIGVGVAFGLAFSFAFGRPDDDDQSGPGAS